MASPKSKSPVSDHESEGIGNGELGVIVGASKAIGVGEVF